MDTQLTTVLLFAAGALASVLLPYLREWLDERAPFDWRQLVGQLLAVLMVIAGQVTGLVESLSNATLAEAFYIGWGISSIGRFGQKAYDTARKKLNGA